MTITGNQPAIFVYDCKANKQPSPYVRVSPYELAVTLFLGGERRGLSLEPLSAADHSRIHGLQEPRFRPSINKPGTCTVQGYKGNRSVPPLTGKVRIWCCVSEQPLCFDGASPIECATFFVTSPDVSMATPRPSDKKRHPGKGGGCLRLVRAS